jgi:hypothetical protein
MEKEFGQKVCTIIKHSFSKYDLVDHYFGPAFGRASRKILMLSTLGENDLVKISNSLLPLGGLSCGGFVVPFLEDSFFPILFLIVKMLLITPVLPGFQGDCKEECKEKSSEQR